MRVIPAIDLLDGKVVRLYQGDYGSVSYYGEDVEKMALQIRDWGFPALHLIDLAGAREGVPTAAEAVSAVARLGLELQVGGGIRSLETARLYLAAGAHRVIVSTSALKEPNFLADLIAEFGPQAVTLSLDVRNGRIGTDGWTSFLERDVGSFLQGPQLQGLENLIVTDITRDGTMQGVDAALYSSIRESVPQITLFAAGGVSSMTALRALEEVGVDGAIIGRAFYESDAFREELIQLQREVAPCS